MNSTAVVALTPPEVTLEESATCCSHSLGFRKRNLALDCRPLTIFNFIYDACQQRIATFACVAEVFWDHDGGSCSRCRPGLRYYPRPSASDSIPRIDSLPFLSVTARPSLNQTLSTNFEFLPVWLFYEKKIRENTTTTLLRAN